MEHINWNQVSAFLSRDEINLPNMDKQIKLLDSLPVRGIIL
jgi:hypothetical protein